MRIKEFFTFLLLAISILLPVSCGDEYLFATDTDCKDCISPKPDEGPISIDISIPADNKGVVLKVFKGEYTEQMMNNDTLAFFNDTVKISPIQINVPVNENYSAVAEYISNGKKIKVVDGSKLKLYSVKSTCNEDCWIYKGGSIDCRLKF